MPTPSESAELLLKCYELRREPVLREARQWWLAEFTPESVEELVEIISGPRNPSYRMVIGYWDMISSFVTFGAIDRDMFRAANGEIFGTLSKIHPFLPRLRERGGFPELAKHLESVVLSYDGAEERLGRLREQFLQRKRAKAATA